MTRNEAIKCLELEDGFTSEDVKHSYARLTKSVRPEERPEEFSKLNEAYRLLSAELRKSGRKANLSDRSVEFKVSQNEDASKTNVISKSEVASKANDDPKTEVVSEVSDDPKTEVVSEVSDDSKTEVVSEVSDDSKTEVASKVNDISKTEVVSEVNDISKAEVGSKVNDKPKTEVVSKTDKLSSTEVTAEIDETASSEVVSAIKEDPEWKQQFIQMFAKEDIYRKRLVAIEEELVSILRLGILERKNGLLLFFRYGNSGVLKSPEFKAFFAERLISVQLDPEETKSIINYYRLRKNSKSTEDILLYARLTKTKPSISKIAELFVIALFISASATMIINGGLPKEPVGYIICVITTLIVFGMLMKLKFPI